MATALEIPRVGVGVILTNSEGQEVLVGRRYVTTLESEIVAYIAHTDHCRVQF